jgi:hypothetical protein
MLLFFCGFNANHLLDYDTGSGSAATAINPRSGNYACRMSSSIQYINKSLDFGSDSFVVGFGVRLATDSANARTVFRVYSGATVQLYLQISGSGSGNVMNLYRGDGTLLATGTTSFPVGTAVTDWRFVELKATIADAGGAYELRIDDLVEYSATAADTLNSGSATPTAIRLMTSVSVATEFDDLYVLDSTGVELNEPLTSAVRVLVLDAAAAGDFAQWTPLTSTNVSNVDETGTHDGDTTYNSAASTGLKDSFNCADLAFTPAAIKAVKGTVIARKDDVGSNSLQVRLRSNGVPTTEADHVLTTAYAAYSTQIAIANPDGGGAWTKGAVDALQIEYERTV